METSKQTTEVEARMGNNPLGKRPNGHHHDTAQ